jgi:hypothetical protein
MGSPPPGGSGQTRNIAIDQSPPAGHPSRAEFENNFRTYVAFMKAFRTVWRSDVGTGEKDVHENPTIVVGGVAVPLDPPGPDAALNARAAEFAGALRVMLETARRRGWIGPPP